RRQARARGAGATGSGTCQNTGPRGVKSSPQREDVWAVPPGELINWGSSLMKPPERLAIRRSKRRGVLGVPARLPRSLSGARAARSAALSRRRTGPAGDLDAPLAPGVAAGLSS
ncbi:hypothetical protein E2I00_007801, partial [Balaenoptera physalus]